MTDRTDDANGLCRRERCGWLVPESESEAMMNQQFGATSTTDEVLEGKDLSGIRVLVTGVSAGLGIETARALASRGAKAVGAARDLVKAERAPGPVRRD